MPSGAVQGSTRRRCRPNVNHRGRAMPGKKICLWNSSMMSRCLDFYGVFLDLILLFHDLLNFVFVCVCMFTSKTFEESQWEWKVVLDVFLFGCDLRRYLTLGNKGLEMLIAGLLSAQPEWLEAEGRKPECKQRVVVFSVYVLPHVCCRQKFCSFLGLFVQSSFCDLFADDFLWVSLSCFECVSLCFMSEPPRPFRRSSSLQPFRLGRAGGKPFPSAWTRRKENISDIRYRIFLIFLRRVISTPPCLKILGPNATSSIAGDLPHQSGGRCSCCTKSEGWQF